MNENSMTVGSLIALLVWLTAVGIFTITLAEGFPSYVVSLWQQGLMLTLLAGFIAIIPVYCFKKK